MKIAAFSAPLMEHSMEEAMGIVAELGFGGIEIACREPHLSPDTPRPRVEEMKRVADGLGLEIPALGGYAGKFSEIGDAECRQAFDDFCRLLEHADMLGADMVRLWPGGPNAFLAEEHHYARAAHWIGKCAEEAGRHGKRIVLEIHNLSLIETVDSSLRLLRLIEADNVGLIHDAGNMYISDTDFGRLSVQGLGRHLFHVHVKDISRKADPGEPGSFRNRTRHGEETFLQCRLGEGEVDHRELLAALRESGYEGWLTLECFAPFPPREQLAYDLRVLKRWIDGESA